LIVSQGGQLGSLEKLIDIGIELGKMTKDVYKAVLSLDIQCLTITSVRSTNSGDITVNRGEDTFSYCPPGAKINSKVKMARAVVAETGRKVNLFLKWPLIFGG
jgi:hypothetical protein